MGKPRSDKFLKLLSRRFGSGRRNWTAQEFCT
jgi:hypothetical protein